jgi:transcription termination/antitermination protein NusG
LATSAVDIADVGTRGALSGATPSPRPDVPWHVLWTHSHCEQMVEDQLAARSFHPFLPKIEVWSVRAGQRRLVSAPMFPGYLFLNDTLGKVAHTEVRKARGLVRILGERWDQPALVPAAEIDGIRRLAASRVPAFAHPYLREGRTVRIVTGPLADVEGILVKSRPEKGLLVLSVHLLQRSVAVEVDCTQVVPA